MADVGDCGPLADHVIPHVLVHAGPNAVLTEPAPTDEESFQGDFRYFFSGMKFAVGVRTAYDRRAA